MKVDNSSGKDPSIDLFAVPYKVFPFGFFRENSFPKLSAFFVLLWGSGLIVTSFSGSLILYITDWGHLAFDVLTPLAMYLLLSLCQQTTIAVKEMNSVTNHADDKDFAGFIQQWNSSSTIWYTLCVLGPPIVQIFNIYLNAVGLPHYGVPMFTDHEDFPLSIEQARINAGFYHVWEAVVSFIIIGFGFNRYIHYLRFVNAYGSRYMSKSSIDLLSPNAMEKLKPFQRLVVKSTFFISLPLTVVAEWFFDHLIRKGYISKMTVVLLAACIAFFVFTLLSQMIWIRRILLRSKEGALSVVDEEIRKARISGDSMRFLTFVNLFTFRDRLVKKSLWAFDTELISKSLSALIVPIFLGAFIQILLEYLMTPLIP